MRQVLETGIPVRYRELEKFRSNASKKAKASKIKEALRISLRWNV